MHVRNGDEATEAMALMPEGSVDEGHADEFQKSHARQEGNPPSTGYPPKSFSSKGIPKLFCFQERYSYNIN